MAIRIYGPNQVAGVAVTTTGKGNIKSDGTEAFAQVVVNAQSDGTIADAATEETLLDVLTELQTPASYLPLPPVAASTDITLTRATVAITTATDTTIVTATAAQSTRLHRAHLSVSGAVTLTWKSASTSLFAVDLPAAGVWSLDFSPYWWAKTANNEALVLTTSAAVNVKGIVDYVKSA
jgi:hypothetical protein